MQRLLLLVIFALLAGVNNTEQVPCINDAATCELVESQSIINNTHYCCKIGFSMQWVGDQTNAKRECVCNRFYHVSDCLQGQFECQSATSLSNDGGNVKCCKHGAKMSSVTNSVINGVVQSYCRCLQYTSTTVQTAHQVTQTDSMSTTMQELQELQFLGAMGLLPEEMQTFVNQMSGGGSGGHANNANNAALDRILNTFVEGLVQGLVKAMTNGNNSSTPNQSVIRRRNRVNNFNRWRNRTMAGRQPVLSYPLPPVPVSTFNQRFPQQALSPIPNSRQNSVMYSSASINPYGRPQNLIQSLLPNSNPYSNTRPSNGPPSFPGR